MSTKIRSIQPCARCLFFVAPPDEEGGKPPLSRLAAWGTVVGDRGEEANVGLVAVKARQTEQFLGRIPWLVPVPALGGCYKAPK
jgi:hypothetical protein